MSYTWKWCWAYGMILCGILALVPPVALGEVVNGSPEGSNDGTSEPSPADLAHMSLDDLLNVQVSVASKKALTTRESPGIVTVISDTEISNSGARDLMDVLQMVPGIAFAVDVQGIVDFGVRGNWAHEGKALLIIDNHEMNELDFSTNQFGNHYPVDQIKKIEIIRGPGSAIYGGYAELAVIKVTTKSAEDLNGAEASIKYGQMGNTYGRENLSLQVGKELGEFSFKVGAFLGAGNRSDQNFTDFYGNQFNMAGNSKLNPTFLNVDVSYKGLDAKFIYDHYVTTYQDGYSIAFPNAIGMNFDSYLTTLKYDITPTAGLVVTPSIALDRFRPWNSVGQDAITVSNMTDQSGNMIYGAQPNGIDYGRRVDRVKAGVVASYDLTEAVNLLAGIEKSFFGAHDDLFTYQTTGTNSVSYNSFAIYTQGILMSNIVNLTLGARYEAHNQFGSAFVPRVALTKVINNFHFKLLASSAFRAPGIDNIDSNPGIQPERTTVYELETGYQFSKSFFLTANVFDITINNPIVYTVITGVNNFYSNFNETGSRGIEVQAQYVGKNTSTTLGYSFYSTAGKNTVPAYQVPGRTDVVLGLPTHKITLNTYYKLIKGLSFNPSIIFLGTRFGYGYGGVPSAVFVNSSTASQSANLINFAPTWLLNAYFSYRDLYFKNLTAGIGVFNLLNQNYQYIQPYYVAQNAHPPLPAPSREFVFDLGYRYAF